MKKRIINTVGCLYVVAAIVFASTAHSTRTPSVAGNQGQGSNVATSDGSTVHVAGMVRGTYSKSAKLVVWSIPGCSGCISFKRDQLPAIVEAGILVEALDASITPPEDDSITSYPTIILYDGD